MAKVRMHADIRAACSREVPGDTQRNLQVQTAFDAVAYKNALLPIWIAAYEYRSQPYRFLVNGVTGQCTGTAPYSWIKVTLLILTIATILMVVFLYAIVGHSTRSARALPHLILSPITLGDGTSCACLWQLRRALA